MISALTIPFWLLSVHYVGDFVLQSDRMALGKSRWNEDPTWLILHCLVYSLCFFMLGPWFMLVTFITHLITDAITSKATSKLWFFRHVTGSPGNLWEYGGGSRHWFFVMIGADQLIHYLTLVLTYHALIGV